MDAFSTIENILKKMRSVSCPDCQKVAKEIEPDFEEIKNYLIDISIRNNELNLIRHELDVSRDWYKFLYDSSPVLFFNIDSEGKIISANKNTSTVLGLPTHQIIGKHITSFILSDYIDNFFNSCNEAIDFNESIPCYIRIQSSNGSVISLSGVVKAIIRDKQTEFYAAFIDNTEVEQNQKIIEEQQKLYSFFFEQAADAFYFLNGDTYTDCNQQALKIFGLQSKSDIIGKHPYDFSPPFQPDGTSSVEKAKLMIDIAYSKGVNNFEWVHLNSNSQLIYTEVYLKPIQKDGYDLVFVTLRDITYKKIAEEQQKLIEANLSTAINYSHIGIALFDIHKTITKYNQVFIDAVKFISGNDVTAKCDLNSLFINVPAILDKFESAYKGISSTFVYDVLIKNTSIYYEISLYPIKVGEEIAGACIFINDITQFKEAEKILSKTNLELEQTVLERTLEIQKQSELLSKLIDNVPDFIVVKDISGKYINCNEAYCKFLNLPKNAIIGKTDYDLFSKDEADAFTDFDKAVFETKTTVRSEQLLRFSDNTLHTLDNIKTPFFDPEGNPIGLIGIARDITEFKKLEDDIKRINHELESIIEKRTIKLQMEIQERIRIEEELKRSREIYRNLFNNVPVGIYRSTLDGKIILANPTLVKMLGFDSINELKDRNLNFEGFLSSSERQSFLNFILSSDEVQVFESTWIKKDGSILNVLEKSRVVRDANGNVLYIEGTAEDISQRKLSEKLQQAVYSISEAAYNLDNLQDLYKFIHHSISQLIFASNFYIAIYDPERNEIHFPYFVDEIDSPKPSFSGPYPFGNGLVEYVINTGHFQLLDEEKLMELSSNRTIEIQGVIPKYWLGVPLKTIGNQTIGVIAVKSYNQDVRFDELTKDILVFVSTQIAMVIYRKKIEEALNLERRLLAERVMERTEELSALNAELERAIRTKDEFLANMSHELRTPLNAILGLSEILLKHQEIYSNDRFQRALTTIHDSGHHLLNLINDILDISKIEAGKFEIYLEDCSVEQIAHSSMNFIRQMANKKDISLHLDIQQDTPKEIYADQIRTKQVLINLLNNAVKFTPKGGSAGLSISAELDNNLIHFAVWDTGIGIRQEDMNKLFKPFSQISSNLSREYEGTGLGLTLVAKLTEMMGGSVAVESQFGVGSKFTVTLPIKNKNAFDAYYDELLNKQFSYIKNALLINSSKEDAELLRQDLERFGIASDFYDFEQKIEDTLYQKKYDIVILDVLLWDKSGWDYLKHIKLHEEHKYIPVVIVSILKEKTRAIANGADGYVQKPYKLITLYETLNKVDLKLEKQKAKLLVDSEINDMTNEKILILLAEDNEANLETMEAFLEYAGYSVLVARNGKEAIESAIEYKPDIILMDIQMPKMDGIEAIRILKNDHNTSHIPIIALTALAMPGDRDRCFAAGANDYISKPVNFDTLVSSINDLVDKK
ncbi:MAG: PAS domain S-box protein [Bacteroidota bacterium]